MRADPNIATNNAGYLCVVEKKMLENDAINGCKMINNNAEKNHYYHTYDDKSQ